MKAPDFPPDEEYRIDALRSLTLLDTPPEPDFDTIVQLGQRLFQVPTCMVSLIDSDRQWFKACVGLSASETPRAVSFCGHAILTPDVFVVADTREDERFFDNPLVTGPPHIRFYAGAPLRLPSGYTIGTVCLLAPEPRSDFGPAQRAQLADLAALAVKLIALRALRDEMDRSRQSADRFQAALLAMPQAVAVADAAGMIEASNPAFDALCAEPPFWGMSLADALGLEEAQWRAIREAGEDTVLAVGETRLVIRPDAQGFIVTAEVR